MYRVYFSWVHDRDLDRDIHRVLEKNGFECTNEEWRLGASLEEIDEAIRTYDLCVFYAFSGRGSLNETMELNSALHLNRRVVLIRTSPDQTECSGIPLDKIRMSRAVIVDLFGGVKISDLPGLMKEFAQSGDSRESYWFSDSEVPEDPYEGSGNFLYITFAEQDRLKAYRIIRKMQQDGYRVWYSREPKTEDQAEQIAGLIGRCSCMIALISPSFIDSEDCRDEISLARDLNKERLLVYLEKTKLSPGMAMRLLRLQAIHKYTYKTLREFYDKLYSARGIAPAKEA